MSTGMSTRWSSGERRVCVPLCVCLCVCEHDDTWSNSCLLDPSQAPQSMAQQGGGWGGEQMWWNFKSEIVRWQMNAPLCDHALNLKPDYHSTWQVQHDIPVLREIPVTSDKILPQAARRLTMSLNFLWFYFEISPPAIRSKRQQQQQQLQSGGKKGGYVNQRRQNGKMDIIRSHIVI